MITEPDAQAEAARRAVDALAGATERMDDRHEIGAVLASLSEATESLSETLHRIASAHDHCRGRAGQPRLGTSQPPQYPMSWELHRAGEILHQVSTLLQHAREATAGEARPRPLSARPITRHRHPNLPDVGL